MEFLGDDTLTIITRGNGVTELYFSKQVGFGDYPDMKWLRELSDAECDSIARDPWKLFKPHIDH